MLGCVVLASTHLLALKVYGANTNSILNASMGFDDATLEPTYVLRTGAPGNGTSCTFLNGDAFISPCV